MGFFDGSGRFSFIGRNEELAKTGGLSMFSDLKHDFGGSGGGTSTYASDVMAGLTRERWADYVSNFVPIENKLIDYATNPDTVNNAMASASADVAGAFSAREGAVARNLRGLGLTLNEDEQAAASKATGLARSLADVQGQNLARDATVSRQQQILGNPAPDIVRANTAVGG